MVIRMRKFLDGDARKMLPDDLFGQGVAQEIVVDGHAEIAGNIERSARGAILHAEDFIQGVGQNVQRSQWDFERVLAFENAPLHFAELAEGEG